MQESSEDSPSPDPYSLNPPIHTISPQLKQSLIDKAVQFNKAEKTFLDQQFFSSSYYFILSLKWFERWKVYVSYDQSINNAVPNKFFGCGELPIINQDIVDSKFQSAISFDEINEPYNKSMHPLLEQKKDYIFISEQMWNIIKSDDSLELKRYVVETPDGKKVELYYRKLTIIPIFNEYLKDIEKDLTEKFIFITFQFSHYKTVEHMKKQISQLTRKKLGYQYKNSFDRDYPSKLWQLAENTQRNVLLNTMLQGCKANSTFSYKIYLDGEKIDDEKQMSELDIMESTLFFFQMRQQRGNWMLFNKQHSFVSTCSVCKIRGQLKHLCSCKYALYCSKQCKSKDKYYHKHRCPNDAQSDQEKGELTLTQQSRCGVVGLRNLGNTCFMNSGIQCISHIPQLTEYFLKNQYIEDINKQNPLGTKGELSQAYGKVVKQLWYGDQSSISPSQLKRAIGKYQPMFSGYNQHDSGELITYLLDGLHEDLNKIKKKPYIETKDYDSRPDQIIAKEQWEQHLMRNKSKMTQIMYGQYRSVLDCPSCQYRSIQFDPFMMCSLPLINNSLKKIDLVYLSKHVLCEKIQITFEKDCGWRMSDILNQVKNRVQKPESRMIAYVTSYSSCEIIDMNRLVNDVRSEYKYRKIYVRQLEPEEDPQDSISINLGNSICSSYYKDESYRRSMIPFRIYFFKKSTPLKDVHQKLISYYKEVKEIKDYESEVVNVEKKQQPLRLLSIPFSRYYECQYCGNKGCEGCQIPYDDKPLQQYTKEISQHKIQFQIYWRHQSKEIQDLFEKFTDGIKKESAKEDESSKIKKGDTTLYDCLKLFEQPQTLAEDNQWYCPKCKNFVLAKKQMHIYKAPKILILCLKRFKRKQYFQQKYNIYVEFPLEGLDLSEYVLNHKLPNQEGGQEKVVYDLFGISNHFGSTGGGHYTAYCKNPKTNKWYDFDDSFVKQVSAHTVVSEGAYILFYRRR